MGHDFDKIRRSEELDLKEVTKFFEKQGFSNLDLFQNWRHVTGTFEKDGVKRYLKLASTPDISEWTSNEYHWNKIMNNLSGGQELSMKVPQVFEHGDYDGRFWFVLEFVDGSPIVEPEDKDNADALLEKLDQIVAVTIDFLNIEPQETLPKERAVAQDESKQLSPEEKKEKNARPASALDEQSDYQAEDLYSYIESFMDAHGKEIFSIDKVITHQDFVPWHMLQNKSGELYLIDSEHGKTKGWKFYDVAYFYHRVYTKLQRPDIADEYLSRFNAKYSFSDIEKKFLMFWFAQRSIGGYFDIANDSVTDLDLQHRLKDRVLKEDFDLT